MRRVVIILKQSCFKYIFSELWSCPSCYSVFIKKKMNICICARICPILTCHCISTLSVHVSALSLHVIVYLPYLYMYLSYPNMSLYIYLICTCFCPILTCHCISTLSVHVSVLSLHVIVYLSLIHI